MTHTPTGTCVARHYKLKEPVPPECRRLWNERFKEYRRAKASAKACKWCGKEYQSQAAAAGYCSPACVAYGRAGVCSTEVPLGHPARNYPATEIPPEHPARMVPRVFVACVCESCGEQFVHNRRVKFCSSRCQKRETKRKNFLRNPESRRQAKDRRRTREREAESEPISRQAVYERDNWLCGLCGGEMSRVYSPHDPLSPTLDHIIPLARGGAHLYTNVQAAHSQCNSLKSDNMHLTDPADQV